MVVVIKKITILVHVLACTGVSRHAVQRIAMSIHPPMTVTVVMNVKPLAPGPIRMQGLAIMMQSMAVAAGVHQ